MILIKENEVYAAFKVGIEKEKSPDNNITQLKRFVEANGIRGVLDIFFRDIMTVGSARDYALQVVGERGETGEYPRWEIKEDSLLVCDRFNVIHSIINLDSIEKNGFWLPRIAKVKVYQAVNGQKEELKFEGTCLNDFEKTITETRHGYNIKGIGGDIQHFSRDLVYRFDFSEIINN